MKLRELYDGIGIPSNELSKLTTGGDLLYKSSSNQLDRIPIGTEGQVLTVFSGVPIWSSLSPGITVVLFKRSVDGPTLSPTEDNSGTIYIIEPDTDTINVTLPDSPANGTWFGFSDRLGNFTVNNVTISASGTNTLVDGVQTTVTLSNNLANIWLSYFAGNWSVISAESFVDVGGTGGISNPVGTIYQSVQTVTYNDAGTSTMNNGTHNIFSLTANGTSTTLAHSNVPTTGNRYNFELHLTWTSGAITWPTSWTKGMNAPATTGNYIIQGVTVDGGTSFTIQVIYQ